MRFLRVVVQAWEQGAPTFWETLTALVVAVLISVIFIQCTDAPQSQFAPEPTCYVVQTAHYCVPVAPRSN